MADEIRVFTPAQYIKHAGERSAEMGRKREASWWIKSSTGLDLGPFLCEPDARLAKRALELFREDLQWSIANENEKERNQDDPDA